MAIPLGTHFKMISLAGKAPSEVLGSGTVSGYKPCGQYAYRSDFKIVDMSFARLDVIALDRVVLRFSFERTETAFDGHWGASMFTPPETTPGSAWVCLHDTEHSFKGLIHPVPFTDGAVVHVSDRRGLVATGTVACSSQSLEKPVLDKPHPTWAFGLHPYSEEGGDDGPWGMP